MMRYTSIVVLFTGFLCFACNRGDKKIETRTVTVGENRCIVQRMPAGFQEGTGNKAANFDYFRVIIESKAKLMDSSHVNYVNFGMENSIMKVVNNDTILPAVAQRIANGKKESYEYIVSFEKSIQENEFEIFINDKVFEMGQIRIKF